MPIPLVDLKAQYARIKPEIDAAIQEVVESTSFILGPAVSRFEQAFAAYCEVEHCVGTSNGTAALTIALKALGVGPGDEVIVPAMTFIASAAAVHEAGATPVLADVDPVTYTLDPACVERALTPRTRAIMPVHLYGQPADLDPLLALCRQHDLFLVEDAAQAHGARYKGRLAGSIGHAAGFSFYPGKNLGAYGDAGGLTTGDARLAARARQLRDHGRLDKYQHEFTGTNDRMDGLQGAILGAKLPHLDGWNDARRRLAANYTALLADLDVVTPMVAPDVVPVWHLYVIRVAERDRVREALNARGIGAGVHYPIPLHLQPALRHLGYARGDFPVAEALGDQALSLPIYPELTEVQQELVVAALRDLLQG
ncbi:MAG: DegT/DnrJ/EryC1/StrS family aminotransferase [Ardenticatenaceae bacterium]|nr:DegT/DnrJ/EryC1/StrS family aminotransferase [Ardenticatenaceae bacterium]